MPDPLPVSTVASAGPVDREARIEQLLLSGLDLYFAGHYEQAINVWTRVEFLERGHSRARAYIERARGALAEQQRESELLLHQGVEAFDQGDVRAARELIDRAVARSGPTDLALAVLERLNRLDASGHTTAVPVDVVTAVPSPSSERLAAGAAHRWPLAITIALSTASGVLLAALAFDAWLTYRAPTDAAIVLPEETLPIVRPADLSLARARRLAAAGHVHEALRVLEDIGVADPRRGDADRLVTELQHLLLDVSGLPRSSVQDVPDPR